MGRELVILEQTKVSSGKRLSRSLTARNGCRQDPLEFGKKTVRSNVSFVTKSIIPIVKRLIHPRPLKKIGHLFSIISTRNPLTLFSFGVWAGMNIWNGTDLFLQPQAMEWVEDFLKYTDKNISFLYRWLRACPQNFIGLLSNYPGRINFELSVITLGAYRQRLMPHAPSIKHLMKVLDGPAVSSANFYAFDQHTMSKDAEMISRINQKCVLWMGCLTPVRGLKEETAALMRQGRQYLAVESERIYDAGYPNLTTVHTEAYVTAFLNRKRIVSLFDSLELEKKDTVVMAGSIFKILNMFRKKRARFLYVPNSMLGGDSDCTVLLTFDDIAKQLTNEKYVYVPKCVMESGRGRNMDITGVTVEEFSKKTGVKVRVLHKVDTRFANTRLYRNGSLRNFVEDYVRNPLTRPYEELPLSA